MINVRERERERERERFHFGMCTAEACIFQECVAVANKTDYQVQVLEVESFKI